MASLPATVARPAYDPRSISIGTVHLGIGAFHRAHQALFTDGLLSRDPRWGICGVSLQTTTAREQLAPQDGLYTIALKSAAGVERRVVGALREVLFAGDQKDAVIARIAAPGTKIITLTVTEKGYCHDPATGRLNAAHPGIAHDLAHSGEPTTAPGWLVAGLRARMAAGAGAITVVCCDNLPHNGRVVAGIVGEFAARVEAGLAAWIAANVRFPGTMVDRIVPATTPADRAAFAADCGMTDEGLVVAEPFIQWVIEDDFAGGAGNRPRWEDTGAQLVADVAPFELMKLRMLNGSHSAMAYLGYLAGYDFIYQVSADPRFQRLVNGLWDESGATLPPLPGIDIGAYRRDLLARYQNAALPHKTWQIAMDGSQKLPQRLLNPARERLQADASIAHLALAVAGWMRYVGGVDERGAAIDVRDPLAAQCKAICANAGNADPDARVRGLLALAPIFGEDLPADPRFVEAVAGWHRKLARDGVQAVLNAHFA
ncbi:MAG: mannitol dehydrogenase family protein [Betaproteobacteria bacterium]|nr:mannitol dehydrogenase family protein [Betaproteobacteria bacterium]